MSHGDYMAKVPEGFALTAHSDACPNVAIADESGASMGCSSTRGQSHRARRGHDPQLPL